jgi:sec-independent protein translocase protein TatC
MQAMRPQSPRRTRMAEFDESIDKVRAEVKDRAELPGMTLMEHLDELRKRLISAVFYLIGGMVIAYVFHNAELNFLQKPLLDIGLKMTMTHPTDALNLVLKATFVFGAIYASPFILYQLWLFISPGMYAHERRYVVPFMGSTVALFLSGAWFGYRFVLPGAMVFLIEQMGKNFEHMITIEDYTSFFLAVILGLGVCFELPILMFFLALFGLVDHKFFLKQWRYAVLVIFLVSSIICPLQDPFSMCMFASPMLALYLIGVLVAFYVHPNRRNKKLEPSTS